MLPSRTSLTGGMFDLLVLAAVIPAIAWQDSGCIISAFGPYKEDGSLLLMCNLADYDMNVAVNFTWQQVASMNSSPVYVPKDHTFESGNASFLKLMNNTGETRNYVCLNSSTTGHHTNCSMQVPINCTSGVICQSNMPVSFPEPIQITPPPTNGIVAVEEGLNRTITLNYTTSVKWSKVAFIPLCYHEMMYNLSAQMNLTSASTSSAATTSLGVSLTTGAWHTTSSSNSRTVTTVFSSHSTTMTPQFSSPSTTVSAELISPSTTMSAEFISPSTTLPTEYSSASTTLPTESNSNSILVNQYPNLLNACNKLQTGCLYTNSTVRNLLNITFNNFSRECEGVFKITVKTNTTSTVFIQSRIAPEATLYGTTTHNEGKPKSKDHDDHDDDRINPTGMILGVVFLILAAVVIITVVVVFKKKKLSRSRHPLRNKMISTISGSRVQLFNNMAYNKEEQSELEEFPRKHIRFLDTIGKGTFGTVVLAEAMNLLQKKKGPMSRNWATVAVKMTLISDKSNEELKKDFLCELSLMKTIPPHVNIITLYASCTAHDPYLMILEYAQHGDLRKFLLEHRMEKNYANAAFSAYGVGRERHYASAACSWAHTNNKKDKFEGNIYAVPGEQRYTSFPARDSDEITSRDLLSFALQIARGLEHLTRNKIVHRDVAARNVLLFEHNIVKISDFGLARKVGLADVYERTRKGLLPIRWMSPESLFYNQFTEKSDVWSYGVLLWELITLGSTPYPSLDASTVLEKIRERDLLVCPPHSSAVVNNIVTSCWTEDAKSRPTFSLLCQQLEDLLEAEVEYVDLDQMNDHEYSALDTLED